jgi:hypothetical protein
MGRTISHGRPNPGGHFDGFHMRPYGVIADCGARLNRLMPGADWATVERLFAGTVDIFEVPPAEAEAMAEALERAAKRMRRMPAGRKHLELTVTLAESARRAVAAGESWRWS